MLGWAMFRSALLRGLAVALGVAVAAMVLLIVWQMNPSGDGGASELTVAQVGEVTHIRASMTMVEPDGSKGAAGIEESWVDTTGVFARTEQRDSDGKVVKIAVARVNWVRESGDGDFYPRMESYPYAQDGGAPTDIGGPLYFRYFFRSPAVETIGETEADGRTAVLVQAPVESGQNPLPIEGVVDQETGWPFEIRLFKRNGSGGFDSAGEWVIKYELVESLPIESVAYLFDPESVDRTGASFKEMSLSDAQAFTAFPLLYLGDSFDGMALSTITESTPDLDPTIRQVSFVYAEWAGTPPIRLVWQLKVMITPAPTEAGAHFKPPPAWAGLEVVGTRRGQATFSEPSSLRLLTEGVIVDIQGYNTNREQILKAADALIALSPGAVRPSSPTP
jgi:hypothetical protein